MPRLFADRLFRLAPCTSLLSLCKF